MIKNRAILAFILFFSVSFILAGAEDKRILEIRKDFIRINHNQKKYTKIEKEMSGFSLEGGVLNVYKDKDNIVKIVVQFYGEGGNRVTEYYFKNQTLFFVYIVSKTYKMKSDPKTGQWYPDTENPLKYENRFYFSQGKMIRWINEKNVKMSAGANVFKKKEKDILNDSKAALVWANSPEKTIEN